MSSVASSCAPCQSTAESDVTRGQQVLPHHPTFVAQVPEYLWPTVVKQDAASA
jgi:hypothetical protein